MKHSNINPYDLIQVSKIRNRLEVLRTRRHTNEPYSASSPVCKRKGKNGSPNNN